MISRRVFVFTSAALISNRPASAQRQLHAFSSLPDEFSGIERESGGRLGVAVLDTQSGAEAKYRAEERFPILSTFKLLAVAAVLARVDAGRERLDRTITFGPGDIVVNSPITSARVSEG